MLESIIVLGITVLIITFSFPNLKKSQQVATENAFWSSFQQNWRNAQLRAKINHIETGVTFKRETYQVEFTWYENSQFQKQLLDIPATLRVNEFSNFRMHENGYTKPRTQEFESSITHRKYFMKIQLAWGGYHIETK